MARCSHGTKVLNDPNLITWIDGPSPIATSPMKSHFVDNNSDINTKIPSNDKVQILSVDIYII